MIKFQRTLLITLGLLCLTINSATAVETRESWNAYSAKHADPLPVEISEYVGPSHALTLGLFNGGGSLLGIEYEFMVGNKSGIQLGTGTNVYTPILNSYIVGFNSHLGYGLKSSFLSFAFITQRPIEGALLHQVGVIYNYRSTSSRFTTQVGVAKATGSTSLMERVYKDTYGRPTPDIIIHLSVGAYFESY